MNTAALLCSLFSVIITSHFSVIKESQDGSNYGGESPNHWGMIFPFDPLSERKKRPNINIT